MADFYQWFKLYSMPALIVLSGAGLGWLIERLILGSLRKAAVRRKWETGEVIVKSMKGLTFIFFFGLGMYVAVKNLTLPTTAEYYLQKSFTVAIILCITLFASRITVSYIKYYTQGAKDDLPSSSIFANITKVAFYILGFVFILEALGFSITPIVTALGVGGLAVALAMQDTLSNLSAGLSLIASRKIRIGDFIRLQSGEEGYVEDITWRTTTIREIQQNLVVIPNANLAKIVYRNYYLPSTHFIVTIPILLHHVNDFDKIEKICVEEASLMSQTLKGINAEYTPAFRVQQITENGVQCALVLEIKEFNEFGLIRHEFFKRVLPRFGTEGIKYPEKK